MYHLQLASFNNPRRFKWFFGGRQISAATIRIFAKRRKIKERLYNSTMLAVGNSEVKWLRNAKKEGKLKNRKKHTAVRLVCGSQQKTNMSFKQLETFKMMSFKHLETYKNQRLNRVGVV